jgi:hypothetical protein
MRMSWVLRSFGIAYLLVALAFLPLANLPPPLSDAWSVYTGVIFTGMTIISVGLLTLLGPLAMPIAHAAGIVPAYAAQIVFGAICLTVAIYSGTRLLRKDLTPARRGWHMFLLLLAVSAAVLVFCTMYAWLHFG